MNWWAYALSFIYKPSSTIETRFKWTFRKCPKSWTHDSQGSEIWGPCGFFSAIGCFWAAAVVTCSSFSIFHYSFPASLTVPCPPLHSAATDLSNGREGGKFLMVPASFPQWNSIGKPARIQKSLLLPLLFCLPVNIVSPVR